MLYLAGVGASVWGGDGAAVERGGQGRRVARNLGRGVFYQGRSDWGVRLETRGGRRLRRGLGFLCSNAAYHKSSSGTSCSWSKMQEGQRALVARRRAHITGSVMEREIYDLERGKERQTSIDVSTTKIR